MSNTINSFAETTETVVMNDALNDSLESLRISGNLLLRETYSPPWGVSIPDSAKLSELLKTRRNVKVVAFHLVEFGHCEIVSSYGDHSVMTAGDFVICFGGEAHNISLGINAKCVPFDLLMPGGKNQRAPSITGTAPGTSLICGAFSIHNTLLNPLFSALPSMLHANMSRAGTLRNLTGVAQMIVAEMEQKPLASGYVIQRLLEVLCAEAIRTYIDLQQNNGVGWLGSLRDPIVGRAIAAIHANPGNAWSVEQMAGLVAMSPSRFAARFSQATNDSPMSYVAKWRMNLACRRLSESRQSIDQIAAEVGYENTTAFNRAFKKLVGLPPAAWRTQENAA